MRSALKLLSALALVLGGWQAQAAHTQVRLVLSVASARPGDTVMAGIFLQMDPGWHTYWQNPGASGMATTIEWKLPPGITAGAPLWPIPQKLPDKDLTTYIYRDEALVLVPLKLASTLSPGDVPLSAQVSWLECDLQCVPGHAAVEASLKIGAATNPGPDAELLTSWEKKLPKKDPSIMATAAWEKPAAGDERPLVIGWRSSAPADTADLYPDASDSFEVQPAVEPLPSQPGQIRIRKDIKKVSGDWPAQISGLLVQGAGASRSAYQVTLQLGASAQAVGQTPPKLATVASANPPTPGLWKILLYAFVGGLILNIMPCVLPVIALKILGFVGQGKENPGRARLLGLVYAAGVLVSFLVLAGVVLGVKAAGHQAGWGIQFSSPYFLVAMTTLVMLIALNLFGVFEVTLGGRTMDAAAGLASRHGTAGAFFNGLLATLLATSCTAPFLGAAVGFAFAPGQTSGTTLLIFLSVGVGLACPYVLLSWQPGWLKFLPKPGLWMQRFKVAMGFPMLAAAVWLFSLVTVYYAERSWWLAIFLVLVAAAAWMFGEFIQRQQAHRAWAAVAIGAVLLAGYQFVLEGPLRWRQPVAQDSPGALAQSEPGGVGWAPWSMAAVERAQAEHRPVLVDFTAKWCLTCNTIVKPALESSAVRQKLKQIHAVALLGDYTRFPDDITEELSRHGRAGVPLVLVYPPEASKPPIVLPEALTSGMVVGALERAVSNAAP